MKRGIIYLLCYALVSGCHMEIPSAPVATFEVRQEGAGLVTFINNSVNATSFSWDYGDGPVETTSDKTTSHKYSVSGNFSVKLIAQGDGGSAGKSQSISVNVVDPPKAPVADFTFTANNGQEAPSVATFTNTSTGNFTSSQWKVAGSNISTTKDATYTFQNAGTFKVSLTVSGPGGNNTKEVDIEIKSKTPTAPIASFTVATASGVAKFTTSFNNTSQNATTFLWNFDDGQTSTERAPSHDFLYPGVYNVILIATGNGGATNAVAGEVVVLPPARVTESYNGNTIASGTTIYTYTDSDKLVSAKENSNGNNEFENLNTYTYDGQKVTRRTFRQLLKGATSIQGTTDYQYNALGQLVKAVNSFTRSNNGYQYGDRGTTTYEYGANMIVSKITADSTIYTYSSDGVLTGISFIGNGSAQKTRIDGVDYIGSPVVSNGRISSYAYTNGAYRNLTYDSRGQKISDILTDPGRNKKITETWTYDTQNNPETVESKFKGHPRYIQGYTYNNAKIYNRATQNAQQGNNNVAYTIDYNSKGLPVTMKRDNNDSNEMKTYKYILR